MPYEIPSKLVYPIEFKILDETNIALVPIRVDAGMYTLRAPHEICIGTGDMREISMGIQIFIPEVLSFPIADVKTPPVLACHARLDPLFDVITEKGIDLIAPRVLSSAYSSAGELKIIIKNISGKNSKLNLGDPLIGLTFTVTPAIQLGLAPSLARKDYSI